MKLRYYQDGAIQSVLDYFCAGGENAGNPIVAMPTGTGKGPTIGGLIRRIMHEWPKVRILNLTHVKELISQNFEKLNMLWPNAPAGIYSAGLNRRDTMLPILFGGVASVVKSEMILTQHWDIGIIDECHLLSPDDDAMYSRIIEACTARNPRFKVVGFTATPYRLKQGLLTDGGFFTDICVDLTGVEPFNRFINEGYLVPVVPKRMDTIIDVSGVRILGGDYSINKLDEAIERVLLECLKETCDYGTQRKKWLIFTAGVKTADRAAEILNSWGISAVAVHSKHSTTHNDEALKAHRAGKIRALINVGKLTTGYDDPGIDLIAVYRKTMSPGLWVQMLGRGTRPEYMEGFDLEDLNQRLEAIYSSLKQNCLVLDFVENTLELGPINDVRIPRKKGKETGDAPVRICTANALLVNRDRPPQEFVKGCDAYNHAAARFCCNCGNEFMFETKLLQQAGTHELIKENSEPIIEYYNVDRVFYAPHETAKGKSLKVTYACGINSFREFVHIEYGPGLANHKARDWFRQRFMSNGVQIEPPSTVAEMLQYISNFKTPTRIRVRTDKQYPEILSHEFF